MTSIVTERFVSSQVDALGQADDECICSKTDPKYTTAWFGDCPAADYVTFKKVTTIG